MKKSRTINAIIIDDEPGCITNLEHYLNRLCPDIAITATGNDLNMALISASKPDLAFLDIELFNDTIFNSLSTIGAADFKIIFVTAHPQYALKAIKTEAIDYVLKPIAEDDILECYAKIKKHFSLSVTGEPKIATGIPGTERKIIIKSADHVHIIAARDIFYIKGSGFYSEMTFLVNDEIKSVLLSKPLSKVEAEYVFPFLFRVHKSYIVNIDQVDSLYKHEGLDIKMKNGEMIPVAKRRASEFLLFMNA